MAHVEAHDFHTTHKPIITKKIWLSIISVVVFFVLYLGSSEQTLKSPYGIGNKLNTILTNVNSVLFPPWAKRLKVYEL